MNDDIDIKNLQDTLLDVGYTSDGNRPSKSEIVFTEEISDDIENQGIKKVFIRSNIIDI